MEPTQLSEELRKGQNPHMSQSASDYRLVYAGGFDGTTRHTLPDRDR